MKDCTGKEIIVGDKVAFVYMDERENHGIEIGTVSKIYEGEHITLAWVAVRYHEVYVNSKEVLVLESGSGKVVEHKTNEKHCPRCNQYLGTGEIPEIKYCFNCGQRIYWSDKK